MANKHAEAYCWMTYHCVKCHAEERIWNSRDGVTPFIVPCFVCGGVSQHIRWNEDAPENGPFLKKGQRIFVDSLDKEGDPVLVEVINEGPWSFETNVKMWRPANGS